MSTPDNTPNLSPSSPRHRATMRQANSMTFGSLRVSRTSSWIATAITGSLLTGAFVFSQPAVSAPAACPGGANQITNQAQLVEINSDTTTRAGTYCLFNNIALTGTWTPIASFTGKLYGVGRNITGLSGSQGLFSSTNGATIDGVNVAVNITAGGNNVGGLIGTAESTSVSRSTTSGSVSGNRAVGGLIGLIAAGSPVTISHSSSSASVVAAEARAGGFIGETFATGSPTAGVTRWAVISNSFATGSVSALANPTFAASGGFIGNARYVEISNSYASGNVSSSVADAGGFAGTIVASRIENSYATGNVSGVNRVGGFAGYVANSTQPPSLVALSYATGNVTGTSMDVGGFVGYLQSGTVTTSYSTSTVTGQATATGGFAGKVIGGVVSQSIAAGNVTGATSTGGFVGEITAGTVSNTVARGNVSGSTTNVGSFAGAISGGTISDSYAVGVVSGAATNKAGFSGARTSGTVNNSFWNSTDNSALPAVTGATTRANLQQFNTFSTTTPSWSINNGWQINEDYEDPSLSKIWGVCNGTGFPYLRWANKSATTSTDCDHQLVFANAPVGGGQGGGAPAPTLSNVASPVVIEVNPSKVTVSDEIVTLFGAGLNAFTGATVNGRLVEVVQISPNRFSFRAPAGLTGTYDITLVGNNTTLVVPKALTFGSTIREGARTVVPGFAANSTRLTKEMRKEIRAFLRTNPGLNQVVCRGFTSAPATPQDRALARDRGKVTCDLIKRLRPEATVTLRSGSHTDKPGVQIRRVQITLR